MEERWTMVLIQTHTTTRATFLPELEEGHMGLLAGTGGRDTKCLRASHLCPLFDSVEDCEDAM